MPALVHRATSPRHFADDGLSHQSRARSLGLSLHWKGWDLTEESLAILSLLQMEEGCAPTIELTGFPDDRVPMTPTQAAALIAQLSELLAEVAS
jgi:hypothetical protein